MDEYESSEEYNSEEEVSRFKFVPIVLPRNFDPKKVPTTGEEFLHHVIYEAKKCDTIAIANIDIRKFEANQTFSVPMTDGCADAPKSMIPTQQWQTERIDEFALFRKYVASRLPTLPDCDNCKHLHWAQKMDKEYPKFSVVSGFNSHAQLILLGKIMKMLCKVHAGDSISDTMGCWTYSILSVLQIPLSPSIYSVLRDLARKCALIRSKLATDAPPNMYKHLNLFICIIGKYFGQYDLADN